MRITYMANFLPHTKKKNLINLCKENDLFAWRNKVYWWVCEYMRKIVETKATYDIASKQADSKLVVFYPLPNKKIM